ncbi:unnamed protein product [Linum tenue]|uniref:Uncharacterized protein n=1 Tax=Linum tenue TaxID=586396 RepID=A0AAV0KFL9_9ROSI|nr:unnamed protein product [Linum tenue]
MKGVAGASGVNGDEGRSKSVWCLASHNGESAPLYRKSDDPDVEGGEGSSTNPKSPPAAVKEARWFAISPLAVVNRLQPPMDKPDLLF